MRTHRAHIYARIAHLRPPLGLDIVAHILKLNRITAADWISIYGDPTEFPSAARRLATDTGLNADTVSATGIAAQEGRETFSAALLALEMIALILDALTAEAVQCPPSDRH